MTSAVEEEVEQLFRTKTIEQIREVEVQARHEIEEKRQQLRRLVGESYRELLSTSDAVIGIHDSAREIMALVGGVQQQMEELRRDAQDPAATEPPTRTATDRLYETGMQIKLLLDTPEGVWSSLARSDFLGAARRFLSAAEVHRELTGRRGVTAQFPLLQHQWPPVRKLRAETADRALTWLAAPEGVAAGPGPVAEALSALALLKPLDGGELLRAFLGARRGALDACLAAVARDGDGDGVTSVDGVTTSDPQNVIKALSDCCLLVADTAATAACLFCCLAGVTVEPELVRTLRLAARRPLPGPSSGGARGEAWAALAGGAARRAAVLAHSGLSLELSAWLDGVATAFAGAGAGLFAGARGEDLAPVEAAVRATLGSWRCTVRGASPGLASGLVRGASPSRPRRASSSSDSTASEVVEPALSDETSVELGWDDVCHWALGQPRPLWTALLEAQLVARVKQLVTDDARRAVAGVETVVGAAVRCAAAQPAPFPGEYWPSDWTDAVDLRCSWELGGDDAGMSNATSRTVGSPRGVLDARHVPAAKTSSFESTDPVWLTTARQVASLQRVALAHAAQSAAATAGPTAPPGRAAALEPHLRRQVGVAAADLAVFLRDLLATLDVEPRDRAVLGVLVVGHVATALADRGFAGEVPGEQPGHGFDAGKVLSSVHPALDSPALAAAREELRDVGMHAFGVWAAWTAEGLSEEWVRGLTADPGLHAPRPVRGWQEVTSPGVTDPSAADAGFLLPIMPSPATLRMLCGVAREFDRAGGVAALRPQPCAAFEARVSTALAGALRRWLGSGPELSEPGALQLVFDARVAATALGAGSFDARASRRTPLPSAAAAAASAKEWAAAEAAAVATMDPIDWATAGPHLTTNVGACLARLRLLLGLLSGARTAAPPAPREQQTDVKAGAAGTEILRLAPPAPRCALLPVATPPPVPVPAPGGEGGRRRATSAQAGAVDGDDERRVPFPEPDGGAAAHYSFARLRTLVEHRLDDAAASRPAGTSQDPGPASPPSVAQAPGAREVGAAAIEALRGSKLGALLGDRAVEVSASLGDMSFGTGLFSSFTSGLRR